MDIIKSYLQSKYFDLHARYRWYLEHVDKLVSRVMNRLKEKGVIAEYSNRKDPAVFIDNIQYVYFIYCTLPLKKNFRIHLKFQFHLDQPNRHPTLTSSALYRNVNCGSAAKEEELFSKMYHFLAAQLKGLSNEELFSELLRDIAEKNANRIATAYHTNDREDKMGYDYIVTYFNRDYDQKHTIRFNLKSSSHFLKKHKKMHPDICTFVFNNDSYACQNGRKLLRRRFLKFLLLAKDGVVHM